MQNPKIPAWAKLLIVLGIWLACFVVLEMFFRRKNTILDRPTEGKILADGMVWSSKTHHQMAPNWTTKIKQSPQNEEDGIVGIPVFYNAKGLRGELPAPKKIKPRILLLGDSYMEADELPFQDLAATQLNNGSLAHQWEFIQHGVPSWSPITEFAWFYHEGKTLEPDHVFLFIVDNDFFSEGILQGNAFYESQYVFKEGAIPVRIPYLEAPFPDWAYQSRLFYLFEWMFRQPKNILRSIRYNWAYRPNPHPAQFPLKEEIKRYARENNFSEELLNESFKNIVNLDSPIDDRLPVERLLMRLSSTTWSPSLQQGINSGIDSILSFHSYLTERKISLTVLMIPLGIDVDIFEYESARQSLGLKPDVVFNNAPLKNFIHDRLAESGVEFHDLGPLLLDYKSKKCPKCKNYLYFKNDGHWTRHGQAAVAEIIESLVIKG